MTYRILAGDVIEQLKTLPDESVNCVVTSPPYWGLRNYGVEGQIGLEKTPQEYIARLVTVFREVRRVLRKDGTAWVNMGDSYAGSGKGLNGDGTHSSAGTDCKQATSQGCMNAKKTTTPPGLKRKDLVGMPWRLAFALQADGWWLRQDIIWSKPNPMPESVRDRCTKSHEYIFLLTKRPNYYFNQEAILEDVSPNTHARLAQNIQAQISSQRAHGGTKTNGNMKAVGRKLAHSGSGTKNNELFDSAMAIMPEKRNKRSVWEIATQGYKEAHFATFPEEIPRICILAGSPEGGTVLDPFGGSGTTGVVALRYGRKYIGIELNPEYVEMSHRRIQGDNPMFNRPEICSRFTGELLNEVMA